MWMMAAHPHVCVDVVILITVMLIEQLPTHPKDAGCARARCSQLAE